MMHTFRGYHGTRAALVDSIIANGLQPSRNRDEWLGHGTYFFIDGLEDGWQSARDWARVDAWDKRSRRFQQTDLAVIEYEITVDLDKTFDLRSAADAKEFHRARDAWELRHYGGRRPGQWRPAADRYDTAILNHLKVRNDYAAILGQFFIQLSVKERHWQRNSRIPNAAILCLSHPVQPPTSVRVVRVDHVPFNGIELLEGPL
jgi:hypothetical protein